MTFTQCDRCAKWTLKGYQLCMQCRAKILSETIFALVSKQKK